MLGVVVGGMKAPMDARAWVRNLWAAFFDWLEAPPRSKNGERLYTHHGGDPYDRSGEP